MIPFTWRSHLPSSGLRLLFETAAALLAVLAFAFPARGVGPDQIKSPRPADWCVDLTGRISADTLTALNRLGDEVRQQTGGELAVVVIGSTDGRDPHPFATDLFNRWGIGQAGKNNGVLVFAALDDRKAEIILGDGVKDETRVRASRQIMQEIILPRFKQGDPGGALFRGARACAERILHANLDLLQAEAPAPVVKQPVAPIAVPAQAPTNVPPPAAAPRFVQPAMAWPRPQPHRGPWNTLFWLLAGLAAVVAATYGGRKFWRYRPRRCRGCGGMMTLLSESADNEYLLPGEQSEERIGSVNYDVWACGACGKTLKFRYGAMFTRYSRCPRCRAKTRSNTQRTLRAATCVQQGLVEVESRCRNCSFRTTKTHATPKLADTAAATSPLWAGGIADSSNAGISSPSTFDAGFSGGHSSGDGASGGW